MPASLSEHIFGRRSRLEVLRCLYGTFEEPTGREIARRVGLSHQQVHEALRQLEAWGIVGRKIASPAHLFRLNRDHWAVAKLLKPVFEGERKWLEDLLNGVSKGLPKGVVSLVLFGSAARGELRPKSDIDLLALVGTEGDKGKVAEYLAFKGGELRSKYHHPLRPVVLTVREFKDRYARGEDFARDLLKEGKAIRGKPAIRLL